MTLTDVYCVNCSFNMLSSVSMILTEVRTQEGDLVRANEHFHERGYQAIVTLGKMKLSAEADGNVFVITMNQVRSDMMIFASFLIDGTAVCAMHVYDEIERRNRTPYRRY